MSHSVVRFSLPKALLKWLKSTARGTALIALSISTAWVSPVA